MLIISRLEDHKGNCPECCANILFFNAGISPNCSLRVVLAAKEWHICEYLIKELTYD